MRESRRLQAAKRALHPLAASVSACLIASAAQAQSPRLSVEPYAGYGLSTTTRSETAVHYYGQTERTTSSEIIGAGPVVGIEADYRLLPRFGLVASIAYNDRGRYEYAPLAGQAPDPDPGKAGYAWFAKAGASFHLPERGISVFAAPAFVRIQVAEPREGGYPEFSKPVDNVALSVGTRMDFPMPHPSLRLRLGLEDYVTFWNNAEYARRWDRIYLRETWMETRTEISGPPTHFPVLRAGIAWVR